MHVATYVADGNRLFRESVGRMLEGSTFVLKGQAAGLDELTQQLRQASQPADLIAVDSNLTEGDAGASVAMLRHHAPEAKLVVLADRENAATLLPPFHAGVDGCLLKDISGMALVECLDVIRLGERLVSPELLVMATQQTSAAADEAAVQPPHHRLSARELDILTCLVAGHSNKGIANTLNVTEATVKVHLKSILRKINAQNRTQAAVWALNNGIAANSGERA